MSSWVQNCREKRERMLEALSLPEETFPFVHSPDGDGWALLPLTEEQEEEQQRNQRVVLSRDHVRGPHLLARPGDISHSFYLRKLGKVTRASLKSTGTFKLTAVAKAVAEEDIKGGHLFASEAAIVASCSLLVEEDITPNFCWFYGYLSRLVDGWEQREEERHSLLFMSQGKTMLHNVLDGRGHGIPSYWPNSNGLTRRPSLPAVSAAFFQVLFSLHQAWRATGFSHGDLKPDNILCGLENHPMHLRGDYHWHFTVRGGAGGHDTVLSLPTIYLATLIDMDGARVDHPQTRLFAGGDPSPLRCISLPGMVLRGDLKQIPLSVVDWMDWMDPALVEFFGDYVPNHYDTWLRFLGLEKEISVHEVAPVATWSECKQAMRVSPEEVERLLDRGERSLSTFFVFSTVLLLFHLRNLAQDCGEDEEDYRTELRDLCAQMVTAFPPCLLVVLWREFIPGRSSQQAVGEYFLAYLYDALCPHPMTIERAVESPLFTYLCAKTEACFPRREPQEGETEYTLSLSPLNENL